ncbi:hypothetical protein ACRDNQ_14275 [Palleronia sp. KMU-117]|uniref:hypothetical protein n=1 Tax=Palleronia sp. KMU-117 TaxID=3434108 RepID=UPI003D70C3A4
MRASLLIAVALTALAACDMPQDAASRFHPDQDYYEAAGLSQIGRKFRRETPFFVDLDADAQLSSDAMARLDVQAGWMDDFPATRFLVVAMGQGDGGAVPATDPAHGRAESVVAYLLAQGISADRIRARVIPVGPVEVEFDPLQRVTTLVDDQPRSPIAMILAALNGNDLQQGEVVAPGQDAGDVGFPVGVSGGPSVPDGGTDGPAAAETDPQPTGAGTTSQGPVTGGPIPGGPTTGVPAPGAPVASDPAPTAPGGKNAAKREANSGRGNGDEAGDPGNSGGRNQGGDEVI